ncbi:MAG: hypothetical protein KKH88_02240 [Nanoarchaeota archaeon]|nr:hypothetical protein [Nanoarchaeota archaeon]MBU1445209.1 hypothetical protein [Nanoarchaeota archaeon]MBU2406425.1 hypothetical protein [Nanoarchaeota archaeon]MBU2420444.1 hypothetical protein [Nanoarchaeota archaeon]MBU2475746.1 hypothetical protein [Nanoarchaeota archaeon]
MPKKREQKNSFLGLLLFRIIPIILVLIILVLIVKLPHKTNCGNDLNCFNQLASECRPSKVNVIQEENTFEYAIEGLENDNCILTISVVEVSEEASPETTILLEGKSMECSVPIENDLVNIQQNGDILSYCTGPLKESMYELIIQKMYGVIAQNLGSVISEVKNVL